MKKFLFASVLTALTACGQAKQDSEVATTFAPAPSTEESYSFVRDDRYVDGLFQEIKLEKSEDGTYTATHIITTPGFGAPIETTENVIGRNLECTSHVVSAVGLVSLVCSHDNRPADGELVVLSLRLKKDAFDAKLRIATWPSMVGAEGTDVTKTLVKGLELKTNIEIPVDPMLQN